jgi:ectoine hydroxylase-related dioxygenase (phytanoyl-CoA dioxygenase family)
MTTMKSSVAERDSAMSIDRATIDRFDADGAVVLRGVLSVDELRVLALGVERNLSSPGELAALASSHNDPGQFIEDFCNWQRIPEYESTLKDSALPYIAAQLMQSQTARIYHDHLLVKTAGTKQPTPWHQDQPYYNVSGEQNVSFWIPVDSIPRESTLEFLAGSHRMGWLMPRTFMTQQAQWFPEGSLNDIPDMNLPAFRERILGWGLEPGDCVAFHMLTLHAASGSATRRRVFSARYLGDDARHAPRAWRTSPEFPGLHERLMAGAVMDDPLFPLVWP